MICVQNLAYIFYNTLLFELKVVFFLLKGNLMSPKCQVLFITIRRKGKDRLTKVLKNNIKNK